ncbi:orotidine-5'-phosphate decarboxylase [Campylobacter sp. RM6883]|uniref:Orotidine 5'-phosphate decarboxylase n=1 Tax=Campylobacter californiensis TaxID=1032243 RepID=A0ABD4JJA5_9BACT|nr:orotidine-5'-phosphate decarboxylase [Campylobacter sp. RM6914]MBE2985420.1 orotidine-5'-phosphate decarboxylase [Campylobacter sp. RM6883]MBE2986854.1 orotidine-5'-phosphate decarboxylase [Campylobacter sp. RM12919]MBE2988587.1 orotidine-5'-phosphate decarboxylase [Campylobacter sp. RM12920]MBE2995649.1 orotidine-5'-phosphate decarboxylase [Campylobacter sp. RM6913]QCD51333.1 orotidine-5'-phosphate decarboxylase [Campylobacter sp. RM6914]
MKLCVALDMQSREQNLNLAKDLAGLDIWLKVGLRSYLRDGEKFINELKELSGAKIFLDLKLHDIPNTMADAAEVIANLNVDMINVHASAGKRAMCEVITRLNALPVRPLVLAVSALTSFNEKEFKAVYSKNINESVKNFSISAYEAGLDGMVCSVFESKMIKEATSDKFLTLTPGIRPFGEAKGDQSRVANIETARRENSDFIVVGRPIYEDNNPREICERILSQIKAVREMPQA